jgi:hypothetical protein
LKAFLPLLKSCTNLYYDGFGNANSGWPVGDSSNVVFQYLGGEYRLLMKNPNWWVGATPLEDFGSYLLQAEVRSVNGVNGSFGLLFGRKFGWVGFYTFEISPDGNYVMWRYDGNGVWAALDFGFSSAIEQGAATNVLAVERNGNGIRAFVNGVELIDLTDSKHTGVLGVGLTAVSFDQAPLDVRFDNYTVLPIGCGLSEGEQLAHPAFTLPGTETLIAEDQTILDAANSRP